MKRYITIFGFAIMTLSVFGQIDTPNGTGTRIDAQDNTGAFPSLSEPRDKPSLSNTNNRFMTKDEDTTDLEEKKEKDFSMNTDNGLKTKKYDYKPSWLTKDKSMESIPSGDQPLGSFTTSSNTVEILCRDHQYVDGDQVKILVNEKAVVHRVHLREEFQVFVIKLKEGDNVISFEALNQGSSGPNTAHFRVFDENNSLVTENQWNLATGAKGNLLIRKKE